MKLKKRTLPAAPASTVEALAPDASASVFARLRANIAIDKDNLDTNVAEQPELYLEISEQYSLATSRRDKARSNVARTDSELAFSLRPQLAKAGIKDTKDNMSDAILLHERHIAAQQEMDTAQRVVDQWGDLKYSFEQRMRMLREMVQLFATSYFTTRSMGSTREENRNVTASMIRGRINTERKAQGK